MRWWNKVIVLSFGWDLCEREAKGGNLDGVSVNSGVRKQISALCLINAAMVGSIYSIYRE